MVKIIETPRDGFQGLPYIIDTQKKIDYINLLLKCGFDTVEVGSFVSPKYIPQMADTDKVLNSIDTSGTNSKIAVLVATEGGGKKAMNYELIDQVFFPFSISPTFLKKNINRTLDEAESTIDFLQNKCIATNKELVVFFSLGFGPAYGDDWSIELLYHWISRFVNKGIRIFPFSDIFGYANPDKIFSVFSQLKIEFPNVEFGLHLHSGVNQRIEKVDAAYRAGIRRFDTVINGLGGCPQTGKELVGNLPLQDLIDYFEENGIVTGINAEILDKAAKFPFGLI